VGSQRHASLSPTDSGTVLLEASGSGLFTQMLILLRKTALVNLRDPLMYSLRIFMLIFFSIFFSIIFLESRTTDQDNLYYRVFFSWWNSNAAPMLGILSVAAQWLEAAVIKRELKDGYYHPITYTLAHMIIQLPMMFVLGLCNNLPAFIIGGWPWKALPLYWLITTIMLWSFEVLAQFMSLEKLAVMGVANFFQAWFMGLLFNGYLIPLADLFWPIRIFGYVLPLRWTIESATYTLFINGPDYGGTRPCPDTEYTNDPALAIADSVTVPPQCLDTPMGNELRMASGARDFYCPDVAPQRCWGQTGPQILTSLETVYDCFASTDDVVRDFFIIFVFGVAFKLLYVVRLSGLRGGQAPKLE